MSATHDFRNFFLEGPAGRLEAVLWTPPAPSLAVTLRRLPAS